MAKNGKPNITPGPLDGLMRKLDIKIGDQHRKKTGTLDKIKLKKKKKKHFAQAGYEFF
jgi:hypothetical protein